MAASVVIGVNAMQGGGTGPPALSFFQLSPLHAAAFRRDVPVLGSLLTSSGEGSVNVRDAQGRTALHFAALAGHLDACAALFRARCDVHAADEVGNVALHAAAAGGHVSILRAHLEHGVAVDTRGRDGWTALHVAAENGRANACAFLLAHGANVCATGANGTAALYLAAASGDVATCEALLSAGAEVTPDKVRELPLHIAAVKGNSAVVALLLSRGADISAANSTGWTAAHMAAEFGHVDVLTASGKGLHLSAAATYRNWTPLHIAACKGQVAAFKHLLEMGADVMACDCDGETPAHLAAWKDHCPIIEYLIMHTNVEGVAAYADVLTVSDNAGRLPFHVASAWGRTVIRLGQVGPSSTAGILVARADSDTLSYASAGADTCSTTVSRSVAWSRVGPYDSLLGLLLQLLSAAVMDNPRLERALTDAAISIQAAVPDVRSSVVAVVGSFTGAVDAESHPVPLLSDSSAGPVDALLPLLSGSSAGSVDALLPLLSGSSAGPVDTASHAVPLVSATSGSAVEGAMAAVAGIKCDRVRCLHAYDAFKRTHDLVDGAFYVVRGESVVDIPYESRQEAIQDLRRQGTVNFAGMLIMEAGNEWGERDETLCLTHIATSTRIQRSGGFELAKANVALK